MRCFSDTSTDKNEESSANKVGTMIQKNSIKMPRIPLILILIIPLSITEGIVLLIKTIPLLIF